MASEDKLQVYEVGERKTKFHHSKISARGMVQNNYEDKHQES